MEKLKERENWMQFAFNFMRINKSFSWKRDFLKKQDYIG